MPFRDYPSQEEMAQMATRMRSGPPARPMHPPYDAPYEYINPPPYAGVAPAILATQRPPLPAQNPLADLQLALEQELTTYGRSIQWFSYGQFGRTLAANGTENIAYTVDPHAYFVGNELQWGIDSVAGGPTDVTVNLLDGAGRQLFRSPVALTCLPISSLTTFSATPLPYEWILAPGDTLVIRVQNRSGNTHSVTMFVGGFHVYID